MTKAKPLMGRAVRAMLRLQAHDAVNLQQHGLEHAALERIKPQVEAWTERPHSRGIGPATFTRHWPNNGTIAAFIHYSRESGYWVGEVYGKLGHSLWIETRGNTVEQLQALCDRALRAYGIERFA